MTLALDRGLALLERLCGQPEGVPLTTLADELEIPRSACHRLLAELQRRGYVRQARPVPHEMIESKARELLASRGVGIGSGEAGQS